MTDRKLTDRDLLELISLQQKDEWEGDLQYTVENWPWRFDDLSLNLAAIEGRAKPLARAISYHKDEIDAWWDKHEDDADDLINEHRGRQEARIASEESE
ncbi:hypothetical protein [Nocardia flavorosea]|uniref:Uncharacterized protein n=1 Tax=Nocardia flavorosea TaxID=53429 RepID=A0A846YSI0_9NOCA|nr:hypothetical protein [Nocardia flavorosea]NKY60398.1 hypothetical protein [Nocardia flavorosea]